MSSIFTKAFSFIVIFTVPFSPYKPYLFIVLFLILRSPLIFTFEPETKSSQSLPSQLSKYRFSRLMVPFNQISVLLVGFALILSNLTLSNPILYALAPHLNKFPSLP